MSIYQHKKGEWAVLNTPNQIVRQLADCGKSFKEEHGIELHEVLNACHEQISKFMEQFIASDSYQNLQSECAGRCTTVFDYADQIIKKGIGELGGFKDFTATQIKNIMYLHTLATKGELSQDDLKYIDSLVPEPSELVAVANQALGDAGNAGFVAKNAVSIFNKWQKSQVENNSQQGLLEFLTNLHHNLNRVTGALSSIGSRNTHGIFARLNERVNRSLIQLQNASSLFDSVRHHQAITLADTGSSSSASSSSYAEASSKVSDGGMFAHKGKEPKLAQSAQMANRM